MIDKHKDIRQKLINASYDAINHLESILKEPILKADYDNDELGPEKFLSALKAKKQAQLDSFEMLLKIESEQSKIDALDKEVSKQQEKINKSAKGFAETRSK